MIKEVSIKICPNCGTKFDRGFYTGISLTTVVYTFYCSNCKYSFDVEMGEAK